MDSSVLAVKNLKTYFFTRSGVVKAVDDLGFGVGQGECLSLVGESGCGKTTAALSILRLIDRPGRIMGGEVLYHGEDLLRCPDERIRQVRGNKIAMIFQDPQSSLNPVLNVGEQIAEPMILHLGLDAKEAMGKAVGLMGQVGIPKAQDRIKDYPHQFSGGMKQRVMIATALSCQPEVLIADEPTTALDATIKVQILEIFQELKQRRNMSIIYITHDLGMVSEMADRILVMYGGRLAEVGKAWDIFSHPSHPYTKGLLNCLPALSEKERLTPIPGMIPSLIDPPQGCIFYPRCQEHLPICREEKPKESLVSEGHLVACHLYS